MHLSQCMGLSVFLLLWDCLAKCRLKSYVIFEFELSRFDGSM